MTYNSRLAQELACYAETQADGGQIHDRIFRAYFVDGINIAAVDNLVEIGVQAGLDRNDCLDVLTSRSGAPPKEQLNNNLRTSDSPDLSVFIAFGRSGLEHRRSERGREEVRFDARVGFTRARSCS